MVIRVSSITAATRDLLSLRRGGRGGLPRRHIGPVGSRMHHMEWRDGNPELRSSSNAGRPSIAPRKEPGSFSGREAVPPKRATYGPARPSENSRRGNRHHAIHPTNCRFTSGLRLLTGAQNRDSNTSSNIRKLYQKAAADHTKLHSRSRNRTTSGWTGTGRLIQSMQQVEQLHQQLTRTSAHKHEQQQQHMQSTTATAQQQHTSKHQDDTEFSPRKP